MNKRTIWISTAVAGSLILAGGTAAVATTGPAASAPTTTSAASIPAAAPAAAATPASGDAQLEAAIRAALAAVPGTVTEADADDDGTYEVDVRRDGGGVVEVELDSSLKVVSTHAERSDDGKADDRSDVADDRSGEGKADDDGSDADDRAVSAADKDRASQAALARVGSGTVAEVDRSDDADHAWEVEVVSGGHEVEVELAADFHVTAVDRD